MNTPRYTLDHVFLCTSVGASEADRLVQFGLSEGSRNIHPGQGTANRRFFFHNAMLELFWVHDAAEAGSETVRRTALLERWQQRARGGSPFGVCFRPVESPEQASPFPAWEYRPVWLSETHRLFIATNSLRIAEPFLFYMPFNRKPDAGRQPLDHKAGLKTVTALRIRGPSGAHPSVEMQAAEATGVVSFMDGADPLMELGFDGEEQGQRLDLRPHLPVTLCW